MSQLGSIFEGSESPAGGQRGPDLRVRVDVPRTALGAPEGYAAAVPSTIEVDGRRVDRVPGPEGEGKPVPLFLPQTLQPGSVLRLRGQGGRSPDGQGPPGDLFVEIALVDPPPRQWIVPVVVITLGTLAAIAAAAIAIL